MGCPVTSFGRKLEYVHRNPGWTDTVPKKSLPEPPSANLTVKNDVFQKNLGGEGVKGNFNETL